MIKATSKDIEAPASNQFTNRHGRKLWHVTGGVKDHFVVTSAATVLGEPETYVFGCDASGNISNWSELPGSYKGGLDHQKAIDGYLDTLR